MDGSVHGTISHTIYRTSHFPWWRHQMETSSGLLAFVREFQRSPMDSPHKGQWRWLLMFPWCASKQTTEPTVQLPVIWDAMAFIVMPLSCPKVPMTDDSWPEGRVMGCIVSSRSGPCFTIIIAARYAKACYIWLFYHDCISYGPVLWA